MINPTQIGDEVVLTRYKGSTTMSPGYIYVPYIPITTMTMMKPFKITEVLLMSDSEILFHFKQGDREVDTQKINSWNDDRMEFRDFIRKYHVGFYARYKWLLTGVI